MSARILNAGIILFGAPARTGGMAFLATLEPSAVRRAYRAIAVTSHPDASRRGRRDTADGRLFIEASKAYETLMAWVLGGRPVPTVRPRGAEKTRTERPRQERTRPENERQERARTEKPRADKPRTEKPRAEKSRAEKPRAGASGGRAAGSSSRRTGAAAQSPLFYHGAVPRRRLRLAEYLYYTGRVSWQSMIKAIVWQRSVQPRFGEIARELSRISSADLWKILGSKLRHEQTGEAAQRLRILTAADVERVLRLQRLRHRKIGSYFVEEERMSGETLTGLLRELHRHNARFGSSSRP
jgi:hypothetical protein